MKYIEVIKCKRGLSFLDKCGTQEDLKNTDLLSRTHFKTSIFSMQIAGLHNLRSSVIEEIQ